MKSIRWGLLSTANINRALISPIRQSPRSQLAAVASRSLEKAREYAETWRIPEVFGSYQELLDSGTVDAVYISLPNHLHAEWTVKALNSGVHVLCEKPFALKPEDIETVMDLCRSTGLVAAEAFMYRHHPQTLLVQQLVSSGEIGDILLVRGAFMFQLNQDARNPENLNVRLVPEYGGGSLWDVGVYPVSFAQLVMGGSPVRAAGIQTTGPTGVDELFVGQMDYQGGAAGPHLAQICCGFTTPFHTSFEIYGTLGRISITRPFTNLKGGKVFLKRQKGNARQIRVPRKSLYLGEIEDMERAILDGQPNLISLSETRDQIRTIQALYRAARQNRQVAVD